MRSRFPLFCLTVMASLALLSFVTGEAAAKMVKPRNSYVMLDLPDSFKEQDRFAGFTSHDAGATIMVLDLPRVAYLEFLEGFEKVLAKRGYADIQREDLPERGDEYLSFSASQHTPIGQFEKYLLIFHNDKRAAYVTITVNPVEKVETPLSRFNALKILSSAQLDTKPAKDDRRYRLGYLGPFRPRATVAGATTLYVLKSDAKAAGNIDNGTRPTFVVAPSLSRQPIGDLKRVGRALMEKFDRFKDVHLTAEEDTQIAGMKGYGLSAFAKHAASGKPVGIYQMLLAAPKGGYIRLIGVAPKPQFGKLLGEFRRMAVSYRPAADAPAPATLNAKAAANPPSGERDSSSRLP